MLIPPWILITSIVVVAIVIGGSVLVTRRALNEVFFWRGAFKCTSDEACVLLAQAHHANTSAIPSKAPCGAAARQNGHADGAGGPAPEREALLLRYQASLDTVMHTASRFKIDWVSEADADYFRDQYGPAEALGEP